MQSNQLPTTGTPSDRQSPESGKANPKKHTRRQFFIVTGAFVGASALGIGTIYWFNRPGRTLQIYQTASSGGVQSILWSPDGKLIASITHAANSLEIWQTSTGNRLFERSAVDSFQVAWSPDGKYLAATQDVSESNSQRPGIHIWNGTSGALLNTLGKTNFIQVAPHLQAPVAWSPNGKYLAAYGQDTGLEIWDVSVERLVGNYYKLSTRKGGLPPAFLWSHVWLPDSQHLRMLLNPTAQGKQSVLQVVDLDISNGQQRLLTQFSIPTQQTYINLDLAFSPNGHYIAIVQDNYPVEVDTNGLVHVMDAESGKILYTATGFGAPVAWSPDSKRLAFLHSAPDQWQVSLWDALTGGNAFSRGFPLLVSALAWSPDGSAIASGDVNGKIEIWAS